MEQFPKPLRRQFYNSNKRISTMEKKAPNITKKQPASVRIVIEDIGRRAVDLYLKKEKQRKQPNNM